MRATRFSLSSGREYATSFLRDPLEKRFYDGSQANQSQAEDRVRARGNQLEIISDLISLFSSFHHSSWRLSSCCLEAAHSSTRSVFRTTCKGSTCVSIILQILPVTQWFCQSKTASSSSTKEGNSPLPIELDFFKYAQGGTGKRKTDVVSRREANLEAEG